MDGRVCGTDMATDAKACGVSGAAVGGAAVGGVAVGGVAVGDLSCNANVGVGGMGVSGVGAGVKASADADAAAMTGVKASADADVAAMTGVKVCGAGVVTSLGIGCAENLRSLLAQRCGIGGITLFDTSVDVPVGEVAAANDELKRMLGLDPHATVSRTALLGALAVGEALRQACIPEGKRVGIISATSVGGMDLSERFYNDFQADPRSGRLRDIVWHDCSASTDFIAGHNRIDGFCTTVSTACSSAANAIIMAAEMLRRGMADYIVAGGADALCRFTLNGFNSLMILDREPCRPLDKERRGLNLGEGAGYLVLTNDERRTDRLCLLAGYANANDAFHQTAVSDNGEGAYLAMSEAFEMSGLMPGEIDYVNLHGTGTLNNDASELAAVRRVFGALSPAGGSTKSYTGHTLAAAGGVEAVFCVLSVVNGARYANLRLENLAGEGVTPVTATQTGLNIRNVLSNSFGFGGNCSSLIFSK